MALSKTPFLRAATALIVTLFVMLMSSNLAAAAGWETTRDLAMRLKEAGRAVEAYQAAAGFTSGNDTDMFDREFVCGWIALRSLNRPDIALDHFKRMTAHIAGIKSDRQGVSKSKAGYWLGRALKASGRQSDANRLFNASMIFSTTFYGQLSASELKKSIDRSRIPRTMMDSYPLKSFYWHDNRVAKELLHAVIREESRFNQNANSNKAARGMMQVLDGTAKHVGRTVGVNVDVNMMRQSSDYNVVIGSRYLGDLLAQYNGDTMLALAGYNAGPQRADEWLARFGDPRTGRIDSIDFAESIPFRETREYVQKVIGSYVVYRALTQN